jgi:hypothetical protein
LLFLLVFSFIVNQGGGIVLHAAAFGAYNSTPISNGGGRFGMNGNRRMCKIKELSQEMQQILVQETGVLDVPFTWSI